KRGPIAVEGEGPLGRGHTDHLLVGARQQPLFHGTVGGAIDQLDRPVTDRHHRHHRDNVAWLDAGQVRHCGELFKLHGLTISTWTSRPTACAARVSVSSITDSLSRSSKAVELAGTVQTLSRIKSGGVKIKRQQPMTHMAEAPKRASARR